VDRRERKVKVPASFSMLFCAGLLAGCQARQPTEATPAALRIQLDPEQSRAAIDVWADATVRIDRELIQAEAAGDARSIRMLRYRSAFAKEVLSHLREGRYRIVIVDPAHPPRPTQDVLSTYGQVLHDETGDWAALVQVRRSDNPELFELFEASLDDFDPPALIHQASSSSDRIKRE